MAEGQEQVIDPAEGGDQRNRTGQLLLRGMIQREMTQASGAERYRTSNRARKGSPSMVVSRVNT